MQTQQPLRQQLYYWHLLSVAHDAQCLLLVALQDPATEHDVMQNV